MTSKSSPDLAASPSKKTSTGKTASKKKTSKSKAAAGAVAASTTAKRDRVAKDRPPSAAATPMPNRLRQPGFDPFGYDPEFEERLAPTLDALTDRYFRLQIEGTEHL